MMSSGAYGKLRSAIVAFLQKQKTNGKADRQFLELFAIQFHALLHKYAQDEQTFLELLYGDEQSAQIYGRAQQSLDDMILWVERALTEIQEQYQNQLRKQSPVEQVCEYIRTHLAEELSVEELAAYIHLNADYLNRIFKRDMGISVNQYVIQQKMELAKWYLQHTDRTLGDIAAMVGYYNYSSFNRCFTKVTGQSPQKWKSENMSDS